MPGATPTGLEIVSVMMNKSRQIHNLHIGKEAHEEGRESRDSGGSGNGIAANVLDAEQVLAVGFAERIRVNSRADTGAARVGDNGRVDGDNVGHGEEAGQSGTDLGEEQRAFAFPGLRW